MILRKVIRGLTSMRFTALLLGVSAVALGVQSVLLGGELLASPLVDIIFWVMLLSLTLCMARQVAGLIRARRMLSLRRAGILIFHVGIVAVMVGAMLGARWGYKKTLWISEVEPVDAQAEGITGIDGEIELIGVESDYDDSGNLTRYDVLLLADGESTVVHASRPGVLHGIKVYFSDTVSGYDVRVARADGQEEARLAYDGDALELRGAQLRIYRYLPYYNEETNKAFDLQSGNPHVVYLLEADGTGNAIPGIAAIGEEKTLSTGDVILFERQLPYILLIFKSDPGLLVTCLGGILLVFGAMMLVVQKEKK